MDTSRTAPPWERINPAVTADRLQAISTIIVRENDAKIAARDARDWNWNIGCDCHTWILEGIHAASEGEHREWLHVDSKRGDLDLDFRIGGKDGVPFKYYQPSSPGQPHRTLKSINDQFEVIQEALGPDLAPAPDPALRFAVDKDDAGRVTAVRLVQLGMNGDLLYRWPIWSADSAVVPITSAPLPEGVVLSEPNITLPEDEAAELKDRNTEESA